MMRDLVIAFASVIALAAFAGGIAGAALTYRYYPKCEIGNG